MKQRGRWRSVAIAAAIAGTAAAGLGLAAWKLGPLVGKTPFRSLATHISSQGSALPPGKPLGGDEDWPAWRGPRGDGVSRESLPPVWPEGGPKKVWSADVGLGYASPVAAAGRVYLFSLDNGHDALTCFDARTGMIVWNDESPAGWVGSFPGTRATPAIDGDSIFTFGGAGELTRRRLSTGAPVWRVDLMREPGASPPGYGCASSPLVEDGRIFVQGGASGPIAVAVNEATGGVAWRSEAVGGAGYAHPVLADVGGVRELLVFASDALYALDLATGRTIWTQPWRTSYGVNSATPVYWGGDQDVFITSDYGMGCAMLHLSGSDARLLWKTRQVKSKFQQAILDRRFLYANSTGRIKCLAWPDGALRWEATSDDVKVGDNGSIVRAGDALLVMSDAGTLSLLRAMPDGFKNLGSARLFDDEEVWATPLLYGGRVFAKGTRQFACYDLSGK